MSELRPALIVFALLSLLTGFLYPLVVTGIGQGAFPQQANGSVIRAGDRAVGSRLLGQPFSGPQYFWSRPSATAPHPYNAAASSGSNQGPLNPALESAVKERIAACVPRTRAIPPQCLSIS
jgi:K+-transporting ATPase ATPase C chain